MGVEGIGASVVRKEDRRFITGKGRYVDDIKLPGMTFAHFIRSPYAHAKVNSIDASAAMDMPGVVAVLTGQQIVDDKVGNLICGWAITSKDGSPMKMGAWPAMAPETVPRPRTWPRTRTKLSSSIMKNFQPSPMLFRRSNPEHRSFIPRRRAT
jgi:aerobic carbon-monoxide dehydrogenase large subunit